MPKVADLLQVETLENTATPPVTSTVDADVDMEVLRAIPKQFSICDEKTANWLVKKIIAARQYAAHVKQWAEYELRRAEREETTLLFLFGRQIEMWTKTQIETLNGKRKSIALPAGTVGFRTVNSKIVIDDETAVIVWAHQSLPTAVQTIEKLAKTAVNEHFEKTGELPETGAHVEPEREVFSIR